MADPDGIAASVARAPRIPRFVTLGDSIAAVAGLTVAHLIEDAQIHSSWSGGEEAFRGTGLIPERFRFPVRCARPPGPFLRTYGALCRDADGLIRLAWSSPVPARIEHPAPDIELSYYVDGLWKDTCVAHGRAERLEAIGLMPPGRIPRPGRTRTGSDGGYAGLHWQAKLLLDGTVTYTTYRYVINETPGERAERERRAAACQAKLPRKSQFAAGVALQECDWGRVFTGTREALIVAGLAAPAAFPGESGQGKRTGHDERTGARVRLASANHTARAQYTVSIGFSEQEKAIREIRKDEARSLAALPRSAEDFRNARAGAFRFMALAAVAADTLTDGGYRYTSAALERLKDALAVIANELATAEIIFDQSRRAAQIERIKTEAAAAIAQQDKTLQLTIARARHGHGGR